MKEKLTNENINRACEEAGTFLESHGSTARETLRVKLRMEEILMTYQGAFGNDAEFVLETAGRLGRNKLRLTIPGENMDPFAPSGYSSDEDLFIREALNQMGEIPRWRFRRGANEITFTTGKKETSGLGKARDLHSSGSCLRLSCQAAASRGWNSP